MGHRGAAVVGSKEAAEKVCSQSRSFMKYHSFVAVLESLTTAASHEGLEIQVGQGLPEDKCASEGDFRYDQIDSYGNTGPRRRVGPRARRVKRGGY